MAGSADGSKRKCSGTSSGAFFSGRRGGLRHFLHLRDGGRHLVDALRLLLAGFAHFLHDALHLLDARGDRRDGARHLFDVFETLLILEVPLLSRHIPQLVQFFLQCGANRSYDDELRIMALNSLSWTVK